MRTAVVGVALLLVGCATTLGPPANPYTSVEVEQARATCLRANAVWCETRERAVCQPRESRPTAHHRQ